MNYVPKMNRRSFVVAAAAAGGGLALGLDLPFGGPRNIRAQGASPEIGVWVVIRPDETVVIRVVRSEWAKAPSPASPSLSQRSLECDWSKVTIEYPTPGQSVTRKRPWGAYSTGGSRGIRESMARVRAPRRCLGTHDADPGRCKRVESAGFGGNGRQGRHHAQGFEPDHHLRQGGGSRRQAAGAGRPRSGIRRAGRSPANAV